MVESLGMWKQFCSYPDPPSPLPKLYSRIFCLLLEIPQFLHKFVLKYLSTLKIGIYGSNKQTTVRTSAIIFFILLTFSTFVQSYKNIYFAYIISDFLKVCVPLYSCSCPKYFMYNAHRIFLELKFWNNNAHYAGV